MDRKFQPNITNVYLGRREVARLRSFVDTGWQGISQGKIIRTLLNTLPYDHPNDIELIVLCVPKDKLATRERLEHYLHEVEGEIVKHYHPNGE